MSSTSPPSLAATVEHSHSEDVTPIDVEADALASTAPSYLHDLKRAFHRKGCLPSRITVSACFDDDCSLDTQTEADRIREYVRAASFLGAGTITVECEEISNPEVARPALAACAERATREGLRFELEAPISSVTEQPPTTE